MQRNNRRKGKGKEGRKGEREEGRRKEGRKEEGRKRKGLICEARTPVDLWMLLCAPPPPQ